MKLKYVIYCSLVCLTIGSIAGFLAGRRTIEPPGTVKYIRETPIHDTIRRLEPVRVETTVMSLLPMRQDTVYIDRMVYTREVVDTAAIIADYELKRSYAVQLFDNKQYGKLNIGFDVQYNRVGEMSYEFVPVTRIVYQEKAWRPFLSISYGTLGYAGVGAGMFYRSIGVGVQYVTDLKRNGIGFSVVKEL
jgi:hypothetical protein